MSTPLQLPVTPYLTHSILGCGGRIKVEPADFEVEEIPAYPLSGEGEHLFLWVQKTRLSTDQLMGHIRRTLGLAFDDVGTAGLKDLMAITRQWVSIPAKCEPDISKIENEQVQILQTGRHGNKLKPGHLRGNRFGILVRDVDTSKTDEVNQILDVIRSQGMPNFYGPQRFGHGGDTIQLGMRLFQKEKVRVKPFLRKLALSSVQSVLFNVYLANRIADGLYRTALHGDVMCKWPFGGMFTVEDTSAEQQRLDSREIIPSGPIYGAKMFPSRYLVAEREQALLETYGLSRESFSGFGKLMQGTRRMNYVYLDDLKHTWEGDGLRLEFTLPPGCYATVLLGEVMKTSLGDMANENARPKDSPAPTEPTNEAEGETEGEEENGGEE